MLRDHDEDYDLELTADEVRTLAQLLACERDTLCPACGNRFVDPRSANGWCVRCDARRERQLAAKLKWWHNNRGRDADA
ncbi:hypothetical protein GCM10009760_26280 [Kitasatospora kazusensis]|uniref:DksA C4-type domain-containing protein n=1 Tax=Kitasatospora kazusensis TaxID=407974 RepID=A0ABN2ZG99_9ACTN